MKKNILIVDDHEAIIHGVQSVLAEQDHYHVVGIADNGQKAVALAAQTTPDIIIMDISMPEMDGIQAAKEIKKIAPDTAIIIYTMYSESEWVLELFRLGISGYVMKDGPLSDLLLALEAVERGASYFATVAPTVVAGRLIEIEDNKGHEPSLSTLSKRELQVFTLLADGQSIKSIADQLTISPRTVETHKYNIMKKLSLDSQGELTKLALKSGLIQY